MPPCAMLTLPSYTQGDSTAASILEAVKRFQVEEVPLLFSSNDNYTTGLVGPPLTACSDKRHATVGGGPDHVTPRAVNMGLSLTSAPTPAVPLAPYS